MPRESYIEPYMDTYENQHSPRVVRAVDAGDAVYCGRSAVP